MINTIWQFCSPGMLRYGRGALATLSGELHRVKARRPIIITDKNLIGLPILRDAIECLRTDGLDVGIYDGSLPEPSIQIAVDAAGAALAHRADAVVGVGGGSNLDVAKIVAAISTYGGKPSDYFGFDLIPGPILPLIAIPSTAGTGSEVSHSAVLTDISKQIKVSTLSRWLRPTIAIVDPTMTDSCPPRVTAHSGIDALVHAVEALTNRDFSKMVGVDPQARAYEGSYPLTRLVALEAIRLIGCFLVRAYQSPGDREARDGMALAATLAGIAFSNSGVAIVHALEYPIGALTHCSHGEGNGLLLPHVMRYNLKSSTPAMAMISDQLLISDPKSDVETKALAAIEWVVHLQHAINIRTTLRELGLQQDQIARVAEQAFQIKRLMDVNPRTPTRTDLEDILRQAF